MIEKFAKDISLLALDTHYREQNFQKGRKALNYLQGYFKGRIEEAKKDGSFETYYEGKNLLGYFIRVNYLSPYNFQQGVSLNGSYSPNSKKAKRWWRKTLKRELPKCPRGSLLHLGNFHLEDEDLIKSLGFYRDCVQIEGNVYSSLKILRKRNLLIIKKRIKENGLVIRKLTDEKLAKSLAEIVVEEFKKRPWHCRFMAYDEFKKPLAKKFRSYAKNPYKKEFRDTNVWVVLRGKKPLGTFSVVIFESGLHGRRSGLGFELSEELQGIGLGLLAYEKMFEWLRKRGVKAYQGYTSNPAVLHMAREFKRVPIGWHFRKGRPHYPAEHFDLSRN